LADATGVTRRLALPLAVAGLLGALGGVTAAQASGTTTSCPAAGTYVPGTTWHRTVLGNGVSLSEGKKRDSKGVVDMHVLRVTTTATGVHFGPLTRRLAERHTLSSLASGRAHLVAATNTGFYDFNLGAPTGPVISGARPWALGTTHQAAVGFASGNIAQAGHVWLTGTATWSTTHQPVVGLNRVSVPTGISVYTALWGTAHRVVLPSGSVSRYVASGKVTTTTGTYTAAPTSGYLVVARGSTAVAWLKRPPKGATLGITTGVATDAPHAFVQAYGIGVTLVSKQSTASTGFSCRSSYPQPARTAIGYLNGGKTLVIAIVTDHPGTEVHGLDATQMSKLMAELGVTRAFSFDGSGSTELLAKMPRTTSMSIRNYTADGHERTMPLGLGIYVG
jgi:hypothetical protein